MKLTIREQLLGRGKLAKIVMPIFWGLLTVALVYILLANIGCATLQPTTAQLFERNGPDLSTWPAEDVQLYMSRVHAQRE